MLENTLCSPIETISIYSFIHSVEWWSSRILPSFAYWNSNAGQTFTFRFTISHNFIFLDPSHDYRIEWNDANEIHICVWCLFWTQLHRMLIRIYSKRITKSHWKTGAQLILSWFFSTVFVELWLTTTKINTQFNFHSINGSHSIWSSLDCLKKPNSLTWIPKITSNEMISLHFLM